MPLSAPCAEPRHPRPPAPARSGATGRSRGRAAGRRTPGPGAGVAVRRALEPHPGLRSGGPRPGVRDTCGRQGHVGPVHAPRGPCRRPTGDPRGDAAEAPRIRPRRPVPRRGSHHRRRRRTRPRGAGPCRHATLERRDGGVVRRAARRARAAGRVAGAPVVRALRPRTDRRSVVVRDAADVRRGSRPAPHGRPGARARPPRAALPRGVRPRIGRRRGQVLP